MLLDDEELNKQVVEDKEGTYRAEHKECKIDVYPKLIPPPLIPLVPEEFVGAHGSHFIHLGLVLCIDPLQVGHKLLELLRGEGTTHLVNLLESATALHIGRLLRILFSHHFKLTNLFK